MRPAVEADAEGIAFEHSVHFREGRFEPRETVVVANGSAIARTVAIDVRWVGEDQIDGMVVKHRQCLGAIALDYSVAEGCHGFLPVAAVRVARAISMASWTYPFSVLDS